MKLDILQRLNDEPQPDIASCSECGKILLVSDCPVETEGDWENGYYQVLVCPNCEDGGCVDFYEMSAERANEWEEWNNKKNGNSI